MTAVLEIADLSKDYRGLRPLRIQHLAVAAAERVALTGLDQPMAEVFVNLVTGAMLPDSGSVRVFDRATADIADSTEWLALVDRFGIVTERAVLLDGLTVLQNLAVPFTLDLEPLGGEALARVTPLAREVGLAESDWAGAVAALDGAGRARVRLARALALDPQLILLEHPTASVPPERVRALADTIRTVAVQRRIALVAVTADAAFAGIVADRVLALDGATGRWHDRRGWLSRLRRP